MMSTMTMTPLRERKHSSMGWIKRSRLPGLLHKRKHSNADPVPSLTKFDAILDLPGELISGIVSYLDFADIKSLRLVSRDFNHLIAGGDSTVARYWTTYELTHIPQHLLTPSRPAVAWQHVLRQTRRWEVATCLAQTLIHYSQYRIPLQHTAQHNLRSPVLADQVQDKLVPLLFTLSDYLARTKNRLMTLASEDDMSLECQAHLDAQTVTLLEGTPLLDLRLLHRTWLFVLGVLDFVLARPTYAGTVERTVRGWTAEPLNRCKLARVLVFGNLPAISKILSQRDYQDRKKWAHHFLKALSPDLNSHWREKWAGLDVGTDDIPDEGQARKAIRMDIHMHCLWTQGAKLVLDKAGGEHVLSTDQLKPSSNNSIALLSDLADHDLTTPPTALMARQTFVRATGLLPDFSQA